VSEQISDERLREYLEFSASEEDAEMVSILTELSERRKQAGYNRQQRLNFMLRIVKDTMPEISRELRTIYVEQENAIYYARRDAEYWMKKYDEDAEDDASRDRPSSGSLEGND
jgi:hypothetical protein